MIYPRTTEMEQCLKEYHKKVKAMKRIKLTMLKRLFDARQANDVQEQQKLKMIIDRLEQKETEDGKRKQHKKRFTSNNGG